MVQQAAAPLQTLPYLPRGKERIIPVHGFYIRQEEREQLCVRGESITMTNPAGITHVGAIQGIFMEISFGTRLLLDLRPYYDCRELDPYLMERERREVCLKSPDSVVRLDVSRATHLEKLQVAHSQEQDGSLLLCRAYLTESQSWMPAERALLQERLTLEEEEIALASEDEEEEEEDQAGSLSPELCLLKHSFESDFGTRGFVDFLAKDSDTPDKQLFCDQLSKRYFAPLLEVGNSQNEKGRQALMDAVEDATHYYLNPLASPQTEVCHFCRSCTLCTYVITGPGVSFATVSRGCAKRFRRLVSFHQFADQHVGEYTDISLSRLTELHDEFMDLLYRADRCLGRPIRDT